jgi:hypothetical protein
VMVTVSARRSSSMRVPFAITDRNPTNDGVGEQGRRAVPSTDGARVGMICANFSVY